MSKVAVIQMTSCAAVGPNLLATKLLVHKAADEGAKLVVLPENFAFIGKKAEDVLLIKENYGEDGRIQNFMRELARKNDIWIVGGTIPVATSDPHKVRSASIVWNNEGEIVARYDKIHLFDVTLAGVGETYHESAIYSHGDSVVLVETPFGAVGLSICYDLRFPELFGTLRQRGAEIITLPAAFTAATGRAHWEPLLRARAIENQCYFLAAAQFGRHDNHRETHGHSMIIDPWGEVIAEQAFGIGYQVADIDMLRLQILREEFPVWEHKKLGKGDGIF